MWKKENQLERNGFQQIWGKKDCPNFKSHGHNQLPHRIRQISKA
jgi:hypothetical protein